MNSRRCMLPQGAALNTLKIAKKWTVVPTTAAEEERSNEDRRTAPGCRKTSRKPRGPRYQARRDGGRPQLNPAAAGQGVRIIVILVIAITARNQIPCQLCRKREG
jgi:hypothetical protein